jgi:membrane-associated phospholipid phosphatase
VTDRGSGFVRRWRLDGLAALACVGATAAGVAVASHGVSALEERAFRLVNNLPDALERPMWAGQLLGVLFVPLGLAAVAALRRRWRLALALTLLVPAKLLVEFRVIKVVVDRERPATSICHGDLTCLHLRDAPAAGVSLPSGHAIVAMGIWWLVAPYLSRRWQWAALAACLMVPVARVYLGAHNPLDVLVGGAVGIAIAATLNLVLGVPRRRRSAGERVRREDGQIPPASPR